jgi:tRNA G18 (ribose-2'-O)-methylase SpoU
MSRLRQLIRIDDANDPRISAYLNIRERDLVGREGRFLAEGRVVLNILAQSGHKVESILVLENRVEGVADLLVAFDDSVPVYVADQGVMDTIAGFHLHRGLVAIARRKTEPSVEELLDRLPSDALVVVLSAISNHDNMGSIFRNAAAFGADAVILDAQCCDPLYRKAIRVSVGGVLKVPFVRGGSTAEICVALAVRGFALGALSPAGERPVSDLPVTGRRALVLGTEGEGLPYDILASLPTYRIAMSGSFDSLNVGTASGIALHHAAGLAKTVLAPPACSS